MTGLIDRQVNTPLARAFRDIVTAGWATKSDGTVEAPMGHFAIILIEPAEVEGLIDAVFDEVELPDGVTIYPGSYILVEDSDGNSELIEFVSHIGAKQVYNMAAREYAIWTADCPRCESGSHEQSLTGQTLKCLDCGMRWRWSADEMSL